MGREPGARAGRPWATVEKVLLAAIALCGVAAFLPWVSLFGVSVYGVEGDGQITAGAAAVGLVVLLVRRAQAGLWFFIVQALLGAIVGAIGLYHAATTDFAAIGVYLTLLAGIVWFAAAAVGARWRPGVLTSQESAAEVEAPSAEEPPS